MRPEIARALLCLAEGSFVPTVEPRGPYVHEGHPLHGRPVVRRSSGLLEAVCEHGTGHPILELVAFMEQFGAVGARGTWAIHGCDGCCS